MQRILRVLCATMLSTCQSQISSQLLGANGPPIVQWPRKLWTRPWRLVPCQRKAQAGRTDFPWKAGTPGSRPCSSGWCRTSAWTPRWHSTSPQPTVIEPSLSASWLVSLGSAGLLLDSEWNVWSNSEFYLVALQENSSRISLHRR